MLINYILRWNFSLFETHQLIPTCSIYTPLITKSTLYSVKRFNDCETYWLSGKRVNSNKDSYYQRLEEKVIRFRAVVLIGQQCDSIEFPPLYD